MLVSSILQLVHLDICERNTEKISNYNYTTVIRYTDGNHRHTPPLLTHALYNRGGHTSLAWKMEEIIRSFKLL
jgi:hypothetical protein